MEPGLGKEILDRFLQEHWVSVAFLTGTLTTMGVLLAAKWWLKRRWKKAVEESRGKNMSWICSLLREKRTRRHWRSSGVFAGRFGNGPMGACSSVSKP